MRLKNSNVPEAPPAPAKPAPRPVDGGGARPVFDAFALSRIGGRSVNMDAWKAVECTGYFCWAVADGLGGHARSEQASRLAIETVEAQFRANPGCSTDLVARLIAGANQAVLEARADPELSEIATTIVVLVSDGRRAAWGHMGDTRLYRLRDGEAGLMTRDHADPTGRIYRALGAEKVAAPAISEPVDLLRGDMFLLCVDGFWENLTTTELEVDYAKSANAQQWLTLLERRIALRQTADSDNYTAIAAWAIDSKLPSSEAATAAARKPARWGRWVAEGSLAAAAAAICAAVWLVPAPRAFLDELRWRFWVNQNNLAAVTEFARSSNSEQAQQDALRQRAALCRQAQMELVNPSLHGGSTLIGWKTLCGSGARQQETSNGENKVITRTTTPPPPEEVQNVDPVQTAALHEHDDVHPAGSGVANGAANGQGHPGRPGGLAKPVVATQLNRPVAGQSTTSEEGSTTKIQDREPAIQINIQVDNVPLGPTPILSRRAQAWKEKSDKLREDWRQLRNGQDIEAIFALFKNVHGMDIETDVKIKLIDLCDIARKKEDYSPDFEAPRFCKRFK